MVVYFMLSFNFFLRYNIFVYVNPKGGGPVYNRDIIDFFRIINMLVNFRRQVSFEMTKP